MHFTKKYILAAALTAVTALTLTACSGAGDTNPTSDPTKSPNGPAQVDVGIIYSETGVLATYGDAYRNAFEVGLDYATKGTNEVNGTKINVTYHDDAGDPDKAKTTAQGLITDGYKIIGGTTSSGIALQLSELAALEEILYVSGPAAVDAITGANKYTFRSGRQTVQDVITSGTFVDDLKGKNVVVFAEATAFGEGNFAAVKAVLGAGGANVSSILVPSSATEFTPFALQLKEAAPDLIFVAWAGATSGAMWTALTQQDVFSVAPVVTGLGDINTYQAFGDASGSISFLNHYFAGATDNEVNKAMIKGLKEKGKEADLFSPDGFNAAIMIVEAIKQGGDDVNAMITALEGFSFDGPKGKNTVRASDHALIQDMYQVKLVNKNGSWAPELVATLPGADVAPPAAK